MSADRIGYCPRCAKLLGGIEPTTNTLRESFEIWMDIKGKLNIQYDCRCPVCGWVWEYDKSTKADLDIKEKDD